jgi:hypothetical protein
MLFRRIAFVGVVLAVVAGGVLQIRLMHRAALREIHLLVSQQTRLQRQIARQDLELAQIRAPWRIADRLTSLGADVLPPAADRASAEPRKPAGTDPTGQAPQADPAELMTQTTHPGGVARQWPSHPTHSSPKRAPD